jgi:predicted HTH transcriptional regulator
MTIKDIMSGESKNVEFKVTLPEKSIKYMKSVVAFANCSGGKILFGVEDDTCKVVGIDDENIFRQMHLLY